MSYSDNYTNLSPSLVLDFANSKQLDPRVTFVRSSTASYYDGRTLAKAEENLFLQSQVFDNAGWSKANVTVSANTGDTTAPDGTATAEKLTLINGSGAHAVSQSLGIVAATYTVSVFAKKGTQFYFRFGRNTSASFPAPGTWWWDVDAGTFNGTLGAGWSNQSITNVGNGWYRCVVSVTATAAGTDGISFALTDSAGNNIFSADTNTFFLWGAQLEQRSAVTAYTPTTTQPITNYVPQLLTAAAGVPRFDHNPVTGESLGLEIEEQRTNLFTYSEQFDNVDWVKSNSSIAANTIVSPDGTLDGSTLIENTASSQHFVEQSKNVTSGISYTLTCYAKSKERNFIVLAFIGGFAPNISALFNLTDGSIGSSSGSPVTQVTNVGNGWYRFSITATASSTTTTSIQIRTAISSSSGNYQGDGYSGIFIWGAQLEAGAFPTSYIPTGAASATRTADVATMTGVNFSSWYNQSEGTLYTESVLSRQAAVALTAVASINNNTGLDLIANFYRATGNTGNQALVSGVLQCNLDNGIAITPNTVAKIASAYKTNDFAMSTNSGTVQTDTSGALPLPDRMTVGSAASWSALNGHMRRIVYYPARLSNTQLEAITKPAATLGIAANFPSVRPSLKLDFASSKQLDPRVTFVRTSTASYFDTSGVLVSAAAGVPRFDHNPVTGESLGLLIEEQRTNSIRNNTMQGAVAGSPGTLPTNWTANTPINGLNREVVGAGVEGGIQYVDIRYSGTTSSTALTPIYFEGSAQVAALSGQSWTNSAYVSLVGGSTANITLLVIGIDENNNLGNFLTGSSTAFTASSGALLTKRFSHLRTLNNASTAFVRPYVFFTYSSGAAIDITLRIGLPQLELGAFATSVIPTTGTAATRTADVATLTGTNFSSWYRQDEGTITAEYDVTGYNPAAASSFNRAFVMNDGTSANRMLIANTNTGSNLYPYGVMQTNSVTQAEFYITAAQFGINTARKASLAYKFNDTVLVAQTISATTDTSCIVPVINQLGMGSDPGGGFALNGHLRRISYYPVRLSNAQLQTLTQP